MAPIDKILGAMTKGELVAILNGIGKSIDDPVDYLCISRGWYGLGTTGLYTARLLPTKVGPIKPKVLSAVVEAFPVLAQDTKRVDMHILVDHAECYPSLEHAVVHHLKALTKRTLVSNSVKH